MARGSDQPTRRSRGGKRTQRARRAHDTNVRLSEALGLLDTAKREFAAERDPEGIWGLSGHGFELVGRAEQLINEVSREGNDRATLAYTHLSSFLGEYQGWEYATEHAEGCFDMARETLRARKST